MDAACQRATLDNPHLYWTVYLLAAAALGEKPLQYPKWVFALWVYYSAVDGKKPNKVNLFSATGYMKGAYIMFFIKISP